MKRIIKRSSKKGFTLLEVLLATVIMSIVSMMIMQGFLATMNFAHNNLIYSQSGSKNYGKCVAFISSNVNRSLQDRIFDFTTKSTSVTTFSPASGGTSIGSTIKIKTVDYEENGVITPHENVAGKVTTEFNENNVVNHHRHAFFYQPILAKCPADTGSTSTHIVRYCYVPASGSYGWYCTSSGCTYAEASNPISVPSL